MPWFLLVVAGLLETGWAIGLKLSDGFTKPIPSLLTILGIIASMYLLAVAARSLPIGTAYAVWVGIGTAGAVVIGMVFLGEPANAGRIFFLVLLIVSLIGLKATADGQPESPSDSSTTPSSQLPLLPRSPISKK